jgi:hypothetical protein
MKRLKLAIAAALLPLSAHAQDLGQGNLDKAALKTAGFSVNTVEGVIGIIISAVLGLVGVVFLVLTVYGGYIWMTAGGDEGKVEKAKSTISRSIVGLVVVLAAYAITYFVIDKLLTATIK